MKNKVINHLVLLCFSILSLYIIICSFSSQNSEEEQAINLLKEWLASPMQAIAEQSFAKVPLSKEGAFTVKQLVWEDAQNKILNLYREAWENKSFSINDKIMKFDYHVFGEPGKNGRSLFISLHGGGGTTDEINEQQWRNQIRLYSPGEGIYLAPRSPENLWNMWFVPYMYDFYDALISTAVVMENVDPNKVYIVGYSAGGDGVYRLSTIMADRWAAAGMMAGHPGDAEPMNLRNIGFTLWMGGNDDAYERNQKAAEWDGKMKILAEKYPDEYRHNTNILEGMPHWMNNLDKEGITWMQQFTRNPLPMNVSWRQGDEKQSTFYWLSVNTGFEGNPELIVERNGNNFNVVKSDYSKFRIALNDEMVDFDKKITVTYKNKTIFKAKVSRNILETYNSMNVRFDKEYIFSAYIDVIMP